MIQQGDKCWVQSFVVKHFGICTGVGNDGELWFVHNIEGGVVHATFADFARGRAVHVAQQAAPGTEVLVALRALALVGRQYDLLSFNCEHAANLAANGKAESPQVRTGVVIGGFLSLAALLVANQNGTSVDRSGYRRSSNGQFASRRWW